MAEPDSLIHPPKRLVQDLASPATQNPPKSFPSFLYKAIFVAVFIAILPLFPSQAPEFVNQTILTTTWELIHLLLVGIAISYGLFSHRNVDPVIEKEIPRKPDSPQSYVSRILQVSSVFDDDESDSPTGFPDNNKIQTWNSQYQRGEPVVVVAEGSSNDGNSSNTSLFLPVRSLKSRVSDPELLDSYDEIDGYSGSGNGSRFVSKDRDEIGRIGSIVGSLDPLDSKEEPKDRVVLPSPIPWRSRSGRMEMKDESDAATPPSYSLPPSVVDTESGPSFRSPSFRSPNAQTASKTPSPRKLSPSPSLSPEMRAKTSEDLGKKKSFYKPTPPPTPPPPPPLPVGHGSLSISEKRDVKRSFTDELKDLSRKGRESYLSENDLGINSSSSDAKPRNNVEGSPVGRSVRTIRSNPSLEKLGGVIPQPQQPPRHQKDKKNEFMEKFIIASDDSDSDDDSEGSDVEEASNSAVEAGPDENEVDKKADEFIAKFREQIRLQRIESIKKSSGQRRTRNSK